MAFIVKYLLLCFSWLALVTAEDTSSPVARGTNVTYHGVYASEVEAFIGIRFAHDTAGENRFKPPIPFIPTPGSHIFATSTGPICPQLNLTLEYSYAKTISEDCLRLNVWRPNGTTNSDKLPVLVWIYGGSLTQGDKDDFSFDPGDMLLQSVANGHPIMHVELNYRLGIFGFAQSAALREEGSENAGVKDQRLALEWVYQNIAAFGGDPEKITIHGQSSGGTSVGFQILAYGGSKPYPFQQAICESQALDLAITSNVTRVSMARAVLKSPCNGTALDSASTVQCLRSLPMQVLLDAQLSTTYQTIAQNGGDNWLPTVDGDFLPDAPSTLMREHRFADVRTIIGWCDNDAMLFIEPTIAAPDQARRYIHAYVPGVGPNNLDHLLSLYPSSEFQNTYFPNGTIKLHAQAYRTGRIYRDLVFTCQPIFFGQHIASAGNEVYFYDQNQTASTAFYHFTGRYGLGVAHTSELPFVFGNLSEFSGVPLHPTQSDFQLRNRESRSWSTFAALGRPTLEGHDTLKGWQLADFEDANYGTYVIGGPNEGYSGSTDYNPASKEAMLKEKLAERCAFINSPEMVNQLFY